MKKNKKDYVELTIGQLILLGLGTAALAVFCALWLNGELWQYGMPIV
jgi:hypothetical protein